MDDRRRRFSSRDRRYDNSDKYNDETSQSFFHKRGPDKDNEQHKSDCETVNEKETTEDGDGVQPELVTESNMESEDSEQKRTQVTKISYEVYKERTQLKMETNDILTLEETRYVSIFCNV